MAKFIPVKFRFKEERYQHLKVKKQGLTSVDIVSCVGSPYNHYTLGSGDYMYYNSSNNQTLDEKNDIASSILGRPVYGPVLIAAQEEVMGCED